MKKLRHILLTSLALTGLLLVPATVAAAPYGTFAAETDAKKAIQDGLETGGPDTGVAVEDIIKIALQILSFVAGIIAVIMIIIAGFKFMTGGGDPSSIASARSTLLYAIVGIIVVVFAQLVVRFVLERTTS